MLAFTLFVAGIWFSIPGSSCPPAFSNSAKDGSAKLTTSNKPFNVFAPCLEMSLQIICNYFILSRQKAQQSGEHVLMWRTNPAGKKVYRIIPGPLRESHKIDIGGPSSRLFQDVSSFLHENLLQTPLTQSLQDLHTRTSKRIFLEGPSRSISSGSPQDLLIRTSSRYSHAEL